MKKTLAMLGLIAMTSGCTEPNGAFGRAYCDDTGCFKCEDDRCGAIPNARCDSDADCVSGEKCTTIGCAPPCGGGPCGDGEACVDGFCVPAGFTRIKPFEEVTGCADDEGCPADEYCGEADRCVPRCKSDDQCSPELVCAPCGKCQPKEAPATCGAAPLFCSEEVGCGGGKRCVANRCHFECDAGQDDPCPVGQLCLDGVCADDPEPADPECALDLHCSEGTCINGYCHSRCAGSGDCPGFGALCQMGACQPDFNPVN